MLNQKENNLIIKILEPLIDKRLLEIHKRKKLKGRAGQRLSVNMDDMRLVAKILKKIKS
jgi:hypothetical protein